MFMREQQILGILQPSVYGIAVALLFALSLSASAICQPVVDMPVTLEKGAIRSPEFTVKNKKYLIKLQADKTLPDGQLKCMLGIHHASQPDHCEMMGFHLAVEAEWTLYADGQPVAHGTVQGKDENGEFTNHNISRWIASFTGEKGKKYVLEFTFTKDGTALRVANPRLVVEENPGSFM